MILAAPRLLPHLPREFSNQINQTLGINQPKVIGFQPFWLLARADRPYEDFINTYTYFELTLDNDGSIHKLVNPQEEEPGWTTLRTERFQEKLTKLQKQDVQASLLIHSANDATISALLKDPEKHAQNLVAETSPLMKEYGFNDLNLDIESFKPASQSAQLAYTQFVKEVKNGLEQEDLGTLSVEITAISLFEPRLTQVEELGKIADYIVLMAYDFHYIRSYFTGPVSPVSGAPEVRELDVEMTLQETLDKVPAEKVILALPFYGYEWETISDQPGAATIPGGGATASHERIMELVNDCPECSLEYDETARQPYIIFPDGEFYHQIYFESQRSLQEKIELAEKYELGGVALWALGYEGEGLLEPLADYKSSVNFNPALGIVD